MSVLSCRYYVNMVVDPVSGLYKVYGEQDFYLMGHVELYNLVRYFRSFWPNRENLPSVDTWYKQLEGNIKKKVGKGKAPSNL